MEIDAIYIAIILLKDLNVNTFKSHHTFPYFCI